MTSLIYCVDCGHLHDVVGTGTRETPLHDSPRRQRVEQAVSEMSVERIDESGCAYITMQAYEGQLSDKQLAATGAPMVATDEDNTPLECDECGETPLKQMLLLVEVIDEEERLLALSCEYCGFEPDRASEWEFDIRETETATVHEWICPECGGGEDEYPVWQEYVDVADEHVSEWDETY